jgi:hypothetical protein
MYRKLTPILAAVVTSMLVGGLAWAATGDATAPTAPTLVDSTPGTVPDSTVGTTINPVPESVSGMFTFGAGEAGSVMVDAAAGELTITGVDSTDGWNATIEIATGREVEVTFRSGSARIDFNAESEDGTIRVRVRDRSTGQETEQVFTNSSDDGSAATAPDDSTSATVPDSDDDDSTSTTVPDGDDDDDDDSTSTTVPDGDDDGDDDDSTSTTVPDTTATTAPDVSSVEDGTYSYNVGSAGSVTVIVENGIMRLGNAIPNSGWSASVEKNEADRVRVEFDNGEDDLEIDIRAQGSSLRVDIDD